MQARFVEEYLLDLHATKAAIRAGYSPRSAQVTSSRLLDIPAIQQAIDRAIAKRSKRTEITQDMVVQELAKLAFADMADYVTWGPDGVTVRDLDDLPEGASRAVAEVTNTKRGGRVKLHDKKGALDSLAKHLGMFIERKEIALKGDITYTIGEGYDQKPALLEVIDE
jgi:phage terminase small subunit